VVPIVSNSDVLEKDLRRVSFHFPKLDEPSAQWEDVAAELLKHDQVLCVVNAKRACRELHALMPDGTVHLSGFMCPEERSDQIAAIKVALDCGRQIRVISTQLVEAGVDIDFPVVFRAMAGLDSVAQAAGRCNREMRLNVKGQLGQVHVFNPPRPSPSGLLRKGEDACQSLLRENPSLDPNPVACAEYFRRFYSSVNNFDKPGFLERMMSGNGDAKYQFRSLARNFHLIDDQSQTGIVVRYDGRKASSEALIQRVTEGRIDRDLVRRLQRFTVSIATRLLAVLLEHGMVAEVNGFFVQVNPDLYKLGLGIDVDAQWAPDSLIM
jgi:CRISPR-associated endonuclease/helicase Cas3